MSDWTQVGPPASMLAMSDDEIFALFLTAIAGLTIDDQGVWSLPAEIECAYRLARQVCERVPLDHPSARARALADTAFPLQMLLRGTGLGDGLTDDQYRWLLRAFTERRAALPDLLPATPIGAADISTTAEPSDRAVRHGGKWIEPRFAEMSAEAVAALPACGDCGMPVLEPHPHCG